MDYDGYKITESLYGQIPDPTASKLAESYQVRNSEGGKIAEFESMEETRHFLRGRNLEGLKVWRMKGRPAEIDGIFKARDFIQ